MLVPELLSNMTIDLIPDCISNLIFDVTMRLWPDQALDPISDWPVSHNSSRTRVRTWSRI